MILSPRFGRGVSAALLAVCLGVAAAPATAQLAPSQPIKIVVSAPAGGIGDLAARIVAHRLTEDGHPAIVENRVGGNGIVATDAIAKARPDGYTLIMGNHSTLAILPHMTKVGYDPAKDFVPVALMLAAPNVLVVKAELPVNSVRELIAYGKACALSRRGARGAGRGRRACRPDVRRVSLTREQVLSGQLRALAMLSSQRNPVLPDVPTAAEAGLAGLEGGAWFGLMAPAGTPRPIVDWLNAQTRKAYEASEVSERLTKQGLRLPLGTPEDFAALIVADSKRWGDVIRQGGIKLESN
jgi:tripartite-type tricarboxylate transporter receptor subunit TctC